MIRPNGIAGQPGQRASNGARALAEIRKHGDVARVDLADALDLSPATVSAIIGDLIEAGFIEEAPATTAEGRGRPRVLLRLNPNALHVAGAKLSDGIITVAVLDFCGEVLSTMSAEVPRGKIETGLLVEKTNEALKTALRKASLTKADLAAFGMGVPGFVDVQSGLCHWSPLLSDTPVDIQGQLSKRLSCPIFIDNDANLATLAEMWFGAERAEKDFLVITVEHGVGLGIVLDGSLFRGSRGLGAEFAHTKVQIDGALCRCGQRGCLEAYVADYALAREAAVAVDIADRATMLEQLASQAKEGHGVSASIYRRAGRMLGIGLANLINVFDPPLIILSGEHIHNHDLIAAEVRRTIDANSLSIDRPPARIAVHRWGDHLWARGAGALALDGLAAQAYSTTAQGEGVT